MGEDKYAGDYRVVKHVDPATGKEERRLVYTGEYFSLNLDAREKARRCLLLAGCAALGICGFLVAGLIQSAAARTLLVSMPHMFTMIALFFMLVSAVRILRLKERFTRKERDRALHRGRSACRAQTLLSAAALLGDLFLVATGRGSEVEGLALLGYALMLAAGALSLLVLRDVSAPMVDKGL